MSEFATGQLPIGPDGNVVHAAPLRFGVDSALDVRFYMRGNAEYIVIHVSPQTTIDRQATEDDRNRFPQHYELFASSREGNGNGEAIVGTPVAAADFINATDMKELAYRNIRSVEQLAALSDLVTQRLGERMRELRKDARIWIEARRLAEVTRQAEETAALRSELAEMKALLLTLSQTQQKPRRGRPRKKAVVEALSE